MRIDGFDAAAVGIAPGHDGMVLVYDRALMVEKLCSDDGMTEEGADEYIDYNICGAYMGPGTPIVMEHIEAGTDLDELADMYPED